MFDSNQSFVRSVGVAAPITAVIPLSGTELLLGYQSRLKPDLPFHVYSGPEKLRSFGGRRPQDYDHITSDRLAKARGNVLWVARRNEYVVERYAVDTGSLIGSVRRRVSWFPPHRTSAEFAEHLTRTQAIQPASDSLVWVAIRRRNPAPTRIDTTSFQRSPQGEVIARSITGVESADLYDTILELIDVKNGRPVVAGKVELFGGFLDARHIYTYQEDARGLISIVVWGLVTTR